jgi:autotransporter-associated beta strand protein
MFVQAKHRRRRAVAAACLGVAGGLVHPLAARAASPVVVQNMAGFEGIEEATVIYHPASATFEPDPTNFPNMIDQGPTFIRTTLRNYYPTLGWWDGDRGTTNDDRQRTEAKGIVGLGHQHQNQAFEYSFDFRMNPGFFGVNHFCDVFQLKQTENGSSGAPLSTVALYRNGSGVTEGRIYADSAEKSGSDIVRTFSFTPNIWYHVVVRITPTDKVNATGGVVASINGDAFAGQSDVLMWSDDGGGTNTASNDYRPKFGFYRAIGTSYGVPAGDSWVEHRTITGYIGASNALTWKGGLNSNAWDNNATQNFLNGAAPAAFNAVDQVNFNDTTANTTVNITTSVSPGYVRVNAAQNYTFSGAGGITVGTLAKDGAGTLALATTNSYPGLTDVRAGTLLITGSIGNNSLVSLSGGTIRAGSSAALGSNSTIGTQINGGTLDINGFNLSTEPISVEGTGGGAGAIVNNGAAQTSALNKVTLTGDTTFGGTGRWDIRGSGATLSTGGNACNLAKTGSNQVSFVGTAVDAALGDIAISQGTLGFQTSTNSMGDPTKTVTVAAGATLNFYNTAAVMTKIATLSGGRIWAESGTGGQNTFAGPVTLNGSGGIIEASSGAVLTLSGAVGGAGGLTKNGAGTVTLSGSNTYAGATTVNAGTLVITRPFTTGAAVTLANGATMQLAPSAISPNNVVLKTPTLSPSGSGRLDLADNKLIVTNMPVGSATVGTYNGVSALIQSGRNGGGQGAWSGGGIVTSQSSATAGSLTSIAVASTSQVEAIAATATSLWAGQTVTGGDTLVMYTYAGDANLDGKLNVDDYGRIDTNIGLPTAGWFNGDFNYDGSVNVDDYGILDSNIVIQGSPFATSAEAASNGFAAVPEPSARGAVAIVSMLAGLRRRRATSRAHS